MPAIRDMMREMANATDPDKVRNVNATVQFNLTGEEPGNYYLQITDGEASVTEGEASNPDVTVTAPSEVWKGIMTGEVNPVTAFMTGRFKASGNMALLMQMQSWFNQSA